MLSYSIKAKNLFSKVASAVVSYLPQQQHPTYNRTLPDPRNTAAQTASEWTKVRFSIWIEDVKKRFPIDCFVTYRQTPVIDGSFPYALRVSFIHEIMQQVKFDPDIREPIALSCQTPAGGYIDKCPSVLRKLTEEEVRLVIASNSKAAAKFRTTLH